MWSFRELRRYTFQILLGLLIVSPLSDSAQQPAQGFAFERLYTSAPGAGWIVMDTLDMHGDFGGAVEITSDFERNPVQIPSGATGQPLYVISTAESLDFGLAATYERYRVYTNFTMPARFSGTSGTAGGYAFTAPDLSFGSAPDNIGDVRLGFDTRLLGQAHSAFRLGAGAQIYLPNDNRADYITDGTFRGMLRMLAAGDHGPFTYAGQAGVHLRPLNDAPIPQSPQGSEFLFGLAGGFKIPVRPTQQAVVGAEFFGASSNQSPFQAATTAREWLISSRYEGTGDRGRQGRLKIGLGRGINPQFGAPRWRFVAGVELFGRAK